MFRRRSKRLKQILVFVALGFTLFTLWGMSLLPDYEEDDFIVALEPGEDVTGKTVAFEVVDISFNEISGYTTTSTNGVYYMNQGNPGVPIGEEAMVEVVDYGYAFGNWIITYKHP